MIQQGLTTSFKEQIYTGFATIGPATSEYSSANEVSGSGYGAGGKVLPGVIISADQNGTVFINFNNVDWPASSFTARGALIYNTTQSNKSIAVLDFGADKTCSNQTFTVTMPANTATTALIRFS